MSPFFRLIRLTVFCLFGLQACPGHAGAYDDLIAAVHRDDTEAVLALLQRGLDVNSVDPGGNTLLHVASRNGNLLLIDTLVNNRANLQARNKVGDTPLMLAAYNGKIEAAEKLLAAGADISPKGWTPLHYAVFNGQGDMVRLLLGKKPPLDARAPNEQTALMLAAKMGNIAIVRLLIEAKADPALTDQNGETAEAIARKANNVDIANLLKEQLEQLPAPAPAETLPAKQN